MGKRPQRRDEASGRPVWISLLLDLAAERSLTEIFTLSMLTPMTLTWFWLVNAMSGRVRF